MNWVWESTSSADNGMYVQVGSCDVRDHAKALWPMEQWFQTLKIKWDRRDFYVVAWGSMWLLKSINDRLLCLPWNARLDLDALVWLPLAFNNEMDLTNEFGASRNCRVSCFDWMGAWEGHEINLQRWVEPDQVRGWTGWRTHDLDKNCICHVVKMGWEPGDKKIMGCGHEEIGWCGSKSAGSQI